MYNTVKKRMPILFGLLLSIFAVLITVYDHGFFNVDDSIVSMIVNGLYSSENYCFYLHPLLCAAIKIFGRIFPYADSFRAICFIVFPFSVFMLGFCVLKYARGHIDRAVLLILLTAFILSNIINYTYTLTAVYYTAVGFALLSCGAVQKSKALALAGTLFAVFGIMLRDLAGYLILPFAALDLLTKAAEEIRCKHHSLNDTLKSLLPYYIPIIIIILLLGTSKALVDSSPKYKEAAAYNHARTVLYDYPNRSYAEIARFCPNATENDYTAAANLVLLDTERMDTAFLQELAAHSYTGGYKLSELGIFDVIKYLMFIKADEFYLNITIYISYILFIYVLLSKTGNMQKAAAVLAVLGHFVISAFFVYRGRFVERVSLSLTIGCIYIFSAIILSPLKKSGSKPQYARLKTALSAVICLAAAVLLAFSVKFYASFAFSAEPNNVFNAKLNADDSPFGFTYTDDSLYVWDVEAYDLAALSYFSMQNKLPTKRFLEHNIPHGEWTYGQLYMKDHLKRINAENPLNALITRDNAFYIAKDPKIVETYINEHISKDIHAVCVAEYGEYYVWHFEK